MPDLQPQPRKFQPLPFSPDYIYVSCRQQTVNGKHLDIGDELPTDTPSRVLRSLYELRRIAPATPTLPQNLKEGDEFYLPGVGTCILKRKAQGTNLAASLVRAEPHAEEEPAPQTDQETPPADEPEAAIAGMKPGELRAVHRGFGKWYLFDHMNRRQGGPFTQQEATGYAAAHNANLNKEQQQ